MKRKPLILAHRGFSGKYPENTMLAFEKAYEAGADGIELDVQLSKDGEVVIIHDTTVDRTSNGTGLVSKLTFKEICTLDAACKFKTDVGTQQIPSLKDYLQWVQDKNLLTNIELKTSQFNYKGIEEKVIDLIRYYALEEKIVISSFNSQSIQNFKFLAPDVKCGLLVKSLKPVKSKSTPLSKLRSNALEHTAALDIVETAERLGVEYLHPNYLHLHSSLEREVEEKGLQINTWTVNDEIHMHQLKQKNLYSIITNYPDKLKRILKETKELQRV